MLNSFQVDLIKTIESGQLEDVRKLVIGKYDIDKPLIPLHDIQVQSIASRVPFPTIRGPTPLVLAILYERTDIIEYLINEKHASLIVAVGGLYPIHYACIMGNIDIIDLIITASNQQNCSIDIQNEFKYTPLHLAAANNHIKAVLYLLKKGAVPSIDKLPEKPDSLNTPLHVSMRGNDTTIAEALISKGASLTVKNALNETPKDTAKYFNNTVMFEYLDKVEKREVAVRSFEDLCKTYLDTNTDEDTIKKLTQQVKELTSRLEKLEGHK